MRQGFGPMVEAMARMSRLEGAEGHARIANIKLKRIFPTEAFDLSAAE